MGKSATEEEKEDQLSIPNQSCYPNKSQKIQAFLLLLCFFFSVLISLWHNFKQEVHVHRGRHLLGFRIVGWGRSRWYQRELTFGNR